MFSLEAASVPVSKSQAVEETILAKEDRAADDPAPATPAPGLLPAAGLLPASHPHLHSLRGRMLEWLGQIVIVFVGVYAAFLLNAWQAQRQDRSNHLQILQSLDEEISESVKDAEGQTAEAQATLEHFQKQVAAGEMPALHLMSFSTDYDPADDVALSQAGADHLLKFGTVKALKKLSSIQRQGLMDLRKYQQLSYQLVAPRLNDPKETFYDPRTKRLQPMFGWYLSALQDLSRFMQDDLAASKALLAQVKAERAELR